MQFLETKYSTTSCQDLQSMNARIMFRSQNTDGTFSLLVAKYGENLDIQTLVRGPYSQPQASCVTHFLQQSLVRVLELKQTFMSTLYVLFSTRQAHSLLLPPRAGWKKWHGDDCAKCPSIYCSETYSSCFRETLTVLSLSEILLWYSKVHYVFTRSRHWSCSWARWLQATLSQSHYFKNIFNVILLYIYVKVFQEVCSLEIFGPKFVCF
jgi:hypothetical protein